jgi:hypothetical protein
VSNVEVSNPAWQIKLFEKKINKEPKSDQIAHDRVVGFRVRAALTGDAPH